MIFNMWIVPGKKERRRSSNPALWGGVPCKGQQNETVTWHQFIQGDVSQVSQEDVLPRSVDDIYSRCFV